MTSGHRVNEAARLRASLAEHNFLQLRALGNAMREEATALSPGLVVDIGCGGKPYQPLFDGRYVGLDLMTTHGAPDALGAAERLPLRSEIACVVVSTQQLEHVDDPAAVLAEAARILAPGGTLLLSTHGVWPYHPDPQDLWRWTEAGLCRVVEDAGLVVERVHRQGGLAAVAFGLLVYPLGGVRARSRVARPFAGIIIGIANGVALALDAVLARSQLRHYVSASYLVVARRQSTT